MASWEIAAADLSPNVWLDGGGKVPEATTRPSGGGGSGINFKGGGRKGEATNFRQKRKEGSFVKISLPGSNRLFLRADADGHSVDQFTRAKHVIKGQINYSE